ncbi:MAG: thioesterase family protein [Rikenellaceae bacterium]
MIVTQDLTALAMGSGDMEVFATPAMVALMENAAMLEAAKSLEGGQTTVGIYIEAHHTRATPLGAEVTATATLTAQEGRKLTYEIVAQDPKGEIGKAIHHRFIVDRDKFLSKL